MMKKRIVGFVVLFVAAAVFASGAAAIPPVFPQAAKLKFGPPAGKRYELTNGLVFYLLEDHSLPIIRVNAYIRTGSFYDTQDKIGALELLGTTMRAGGSAKYSADEMNKTLEFLAASVESGMGGEAGRAGMSCLSKDFDKVFDIFTDMLLNPVFDDAKFKIQKDNALESVRRRNDNPYMLAARESNRMFFGRAHPYGWRKEVGTVDSVRREDLISLHKRYYKPNAMVFAISGDFVPENILQAINANFAALPKSALELPEIKEPQMLGQRRVYFVERTVPNAPVRIAMPGPKRHNADDYTMDVANEVLGGGMSSRLFMEVRTRKGLAYSVGSSFAEFDRGGKIEAFSATKNPSVLDAIDEILSQFSKMGSAPVSDSELKKAKDSIINSYVFRFETPQEIISARAVNEYFGYAPDYLDTYPDKIAAVSASEVQDFAKRWYKPESAQIFVAGQAEQFPKHISKFGTTEVLTAD